MVFSDGVISKTNFGRASEQVSTLEQEVLTSDTEARLNQKKAELQNEIRANKTKLLELNVFLFHSFLLLSYLNFVDSRMI